VDIGPTDGANVRKGAIPKTVTRRKNSVRKTTDGSVQVPIIGPDLQPPQPGIPLLEARGAPRINRGANVQTVADELSVSSQDKRF
jgi:hypothetical protein